MFIVSHKPTAKTYALKIFDKLHCIEHTAGFDAVKSLNREALILKQISSPFILQMYQSWQDTKSVYFLLPLIQGGELSKRLYDFTAENDNREVGLPPEHALFYSACISEALAHMHERNIAYRDLKPDNGMCLYYSLRLSTHRPIPCVWVCWGNTSLSHQTPFRLLWSCLEIRSHD